MFRPIRIRRWHIPNGLAIAAALLLLASALAGIEPTADYADSAATLAGSHSDSVALPDPAPERLAEAPVKQTRKFRVSLFLFRH